MTFELKLVMTVWVIWLLGGAILGLLSMIPTTAGRARALWGLLASEALIIAFATVPFLLGTVFAEIAFAVLALRTGWECAVAIAAGREAASWAKWPLAMVVGALALAGWLSAIWVAVIAYAVFAVWSLWRLATVRFPEPSGKGDGLYVPLLFPGLPVFAFAAVLADPALQIALLAGFFFVEVFDSFALLGGRMWGRTRAFPGLSDRKTLEGLVTGFAALCITLVCVNIILLELPWPKLVLAVAATAIAAIVGDLVASSIKRRAGVKDFPAVLPNQGGLLDITDSWLVTGPVLGLLLYYLGPN